MKRYVCAQVLAFAAIVVLTTVIGCKKSEPEEVAPEESKSKPPATKKTEQTPLQASSLDGVIKGQVIYDGTPPEMPILQPLVEHKDCMIGSDAEKRDQTWIVSKDKGVANVVVWLAPPKSNYFVLKDEDKDRSSQEVSIDQPHCAFIPHVTAVYPRYFDGKGHKPTGQVFKVKNSASFSHNSSWVGDPLAGNQGNQTIAPGAHILMELKPQRDPVTISCSIHSWMRAKVWVFDQPYHAVTDESGAFTIKNVPTGVDLTLHAWHEGKGKFETRTVKFMTGDNPLEIKIKQQRAVEATIMDRDFKQRELDNLRRRVQQLETELTPKPELQWPPRDFYLTYHLLAGAMLGMFGAATSLLFNVVGSLFVHQAPLRLIELYLTFPLGKPWYEALQRGEQQSGIVLAIGCCLYLATGMVFGVPFHLVLSRWFSQASYLKRILVASALGLALWLVMFYGLLSWIQPLFFGGSWIVEEIPWWVAALTHLVFAWTMVLVEPLGAFVARPNPIMEKH